MATALAVACAAPEEKAPSDTGEWVYAEVEGPFVELDGTLNDMCALRASGEPVCFGSMDVPTGVLFEHISIGDVSGCGVDLEGSLVCWNRPGGELPPSGRFSIVDVGLHACAVTPEGRTECWWWLWDNESGPAPDPTITHVGTDDTMRCVVGAAGLTCWNDSGEMATWPGSFTQLHTEWELCLLSSNGQVSCVHQPEDVDDARWYPLAEGASSVTSLGPSICWSLTGLPGIGCTGLLYAGEEDEFYEAAVLNAPEREFTALALSYDIVCGLTLEQSLLCWTNTRFNFMPDVLALE